MEKEGYIYIYIGVFLYATENAVPLSQHENIQIWACLLSVLCLQTYKTIFPMTEGSGLIAQLLLNSTAGSVQAPGMTTNKPQAAQTPGNKTECLN